MWPYVLRNAFMPAFIGDFDLVVGNPPWVNWESLPTAYRERTRELWKRYGLFVHGGMAAMLGAGKKDVSMLMAYVATDKLLRPDGRLGFVITQTVFKTAGAGQGFRRFRIGDAGPSVRVEHVDDMTDLKPFVGAANRTALLTWRKGEKTRYPVKYVLWQRRPRARLPEDSALDEVMTTTTRTQLVAAPVSASDPTSAWLSLPRKLIGPLRKLAETGTPAYVAHEGVNTGGANGVYWVLVDGPPDAQDRVPISNLHDIGKTRVPKKHGRVERELVHPLVRGTDISRWGTVSNAHILLVQDPKLRAGVVADRMQNSYPGALRYPKQFEPLLKKRALYRRYYTNGEAPYWSMFNVGGYTLAKHKVLWKDIATDFTAAVVSSANPTVMSAHSVIEVACDSPEEAHYLCAALNSTPARLFIASYLATHASTHPVTTVHLPGFDRGDSDHRALAKASRTAHRAVAVGREADQDVVDRAAARLWGLSWEEVEAMREFFDRLRKRA